MRSSCYFSATQRFLALDTSTEILSLAVGAPDREADALSAGEPPSRMVGLVWRVTFPRPQAIDAVRAALLSCQLPGATARR